MIEHFRQQAYCNLWSNYRLLKACIFFMLDEAPLRREEFAALGISETQVWAAPR